MATNKRVPLQDLVKELPPEFEDEVRDFVEFLLEKRAKKPRRGLKLDWAGALKDLKEQYTSVELQHKASEWRVEEGSSQ